MEYSPYQTSGFIGQLLFSLFLIWEARRKMEFGCLPVTFSALLNSKGLIRLSPTLGERRHILFIYPSLHDYCFMGPEVGHECHGN